MEKARCKRQSRVHDSKNGLRWTESEERGCGMGG